MTWWPHSLPIRSEVRSVRPKENMLRVIHRDDPEWVPNGMEHIVRIMPPIVERPDREGLDAFGVHWSLDEEAEGGTYPTHGRHPLGDLAGWRERIAVPDVASLSWRHVEAQVGQIDRSEYLVEGFVEMGLFERSYLLLGIEEALMAYVTYPDEMRAMLEAIADYKIGLIERFDDVADLDLLWFGDDWGTQISLFLPPTTWREVIMPPTRRIYAAIKARGILVNQHSCGRIEAIFGDMVEMGADMWNPCQPCNDLAALKRAYGDRITFCGGLDSQFVLGRPGVTPGEVRAEVRLRVDQMARGGGYIAQPSHSVPYDPEVLAAMNDEIARYGRAVYSAG